MDIVLISNDDDRAQLITQRVRESSGAHRVRVIDAHARDSALYAEATRRAQLLIVANTELGAQDLARIEQLCAQTPQLSCLLITVATPSTELLMNAMRAGVRHVLSYPLDPAALAAELTLIENKQRGQAQREGRVLSFLSAKGGSGTTFIAANFAAQCASTADRRVLLIDLNRQFADASLYMTDTPPNSTLVELAAQVERVDAALFDASVTRINQHLDLLPGAGDPIKAMQIQPEQLSSLLAFARSRYDVIVFDIGQHIDPLTMTALDQSHTIIPVIQQSLPHLYAGRRLLEILQALGYAHNQIQILVNQYDKNARISLDTLRETLGIGAAHQLPCDHKLAAQATNQGVSVQAIAPRSALSQQLMALTRHFFPLQTPDSGKSLLARFNPFKPAAVAASLSAR